MVNDKTRIIGDPGKFEGECVFVRDLWHDVVMNGMEDETVYDGDTPVSVVLLDKETRKDFELDETDYAVCLWEDSNGFVRSRVMSESDLTAFRSESTFRSECESDSTEEEE